MPPGVQPFNDFPFEGQLPLQCGRRRLQGAAGHYFMMGDHRDDSQDSRYWGFVPGREHRRQGILRLMNFGDLSRIGAFH
jgi:signal peptidase I